VTVRNVSEAPAAAEESMPQNVLRQVAVFIDTWNSNGRSVLRGIHRYQSERGRWAVTMRPQTPDGVPSWLRDGQTDGVLATVPHARFASGVQRLRVPVVNVDVRPIRKFPQVFIDNEATGRLAAEHLLERGLRHFGFIGWPRGILAGMDLRCDGFMHVLAQAGFPCSTLLRWRMGAVGAVIGRPHRRMAAWLRSLPKPIGVMTCGDICALEVLTACRLAGLHVPQDVALISVHDDDLFCRLADPPLSSVHSDFEGVGYQAAALLDHLMAGGKAPPRPILIPPRYVAARASTDVLALEDNELAVVLHYIRRHACRGLRVDEVLRAFPISRNDLQHRLKRAIGRTLKGEIMRVQLEHVKELLLTTEFPLAKVAAHAGYAYPQYMAEAFRTKFGITPRAFRRRFQEKERLDAGGSRLAPPCRVGSLRDD
jgi:LacI family transcriptional regulator